MYRRRPGSFTRRLLSAAALGAVARVLVMIPTNFVILFLEFGMPPARVVKLLLPVIIPFNALKALINAGIALVLVEPVARRAPREASPDSPR
jgi:riboflavin transporter FmnP